MKNWFDVDQRGLAKILERRGKPWILFELVSNAWDEKATRVDVTLERHAGTRQANLTVRDDNPEGFADLTHAFTLFAESAKKGEADKRGRFNAGEKHVLAMCIEASIASTKGTVQFDSQGRHTSRAHTEAGSVFTGYLRMTNEEIAECGRAMLQLLPPAHITTTYNGVALTPRKPLATFEATLPTVLADDEGFLRRTERKTVVEIHEPLEGEVASLYELGVPVVETGDRWHLNIGMKVPLNVDRDNVPPGYLAKLRALVVAHMAEQMVAEDANASWAREALQKHADLVPDEALHRLADLRFGEKRVGFDPSDPEANHRAVAEGYTIVYGGQMSKPEWEAARRSGAVLPAGRVTPTAKPFSTDGKPLRTLPREEWTPAIESVVLYVRRIALPLLAKDIDVVIANDVSWPFAGAYGGGVMHLNLGRLGHKWFEGPLQAINELVVHELAHDLASNHLSEEYYRALTRLGAKLVTLALVEPELFRGIRLAPAA